MNESKTYIHGFSKDEQERLRRQAEFMEYLVYQDVNLSEISNILEVGCGVGAQTQILLRRFPNLTMKCIDLNDSQLEVAREALAQTAYAKGRYEIIKMNAEKMNFADDTFGGAFFCWVLEHVPNPARVLEETRRVLRPNARVFLTEVTNFAFFLDPYCPNIWKFWMAFNDFQYDRGGDPFVGVKLGSLLRDAGYSDVQTNVKVVYADKRYPDRRHKLILYWQELMMSAVDELVKSERVDAEIVEGMKTEFADILKDPNAIIFDSFMQATARVP